MACPCQGGSVGSYEVMTGEGTVPATIGSEANSFATQQAAQVALTRAGVGGFVRATRQPARV
jgi:hypothetical protein